MLKLVILLICIGLVWSMGDKNIVEGSWRVLSVKKCNNSDNYPLQFAVVRKKCDRVTDCFTLQMDAEETIDDSYSLRCYTCKHVEGGCKQYQDISDVSFSGFCKKYAESNIKTAFEMMNMNPPDFPIQPGHYSMENFKMDYCELPKSGPEGSFSVECFILKAEDKRACIFLDLIFRDELDDCPTK